MLFYQYFNACGVLFVWRVLLYVSSWLCKFYCSPPLETTFVFVYVLDGKPTPVRYGQGKFGGFPFSYDSSVNVVRVSDF